MSKKVHGFTIVELMVTMAIGSVLAIAVVATFVTIIGTTPLQKTRNTLSTSLQDALNRINDDVRRSSNASTYNLAADPNAPTSKTGYEHVPGPETDTDDTHFWRMSENRLILSQTPVNSSGEPIYDNAAYAVGARNNIIYYIRDGALYRRVVAANYPDNAVTTTTCARVAEGGCSNSDIRVIDNLDPDAGQAAFKVVYYDQNGNPISYVSKDADGNDQPDYTGFPLTRSIGVEIKLKSGKITGNQTVSISNTMRMQFRTAPNIVPPTTAVDPPSIPPSNGVGEPRLMVGPGGLRLSHQSYVGSGDVYVTGKVSLEVFTRLGGSYSYSATASDQGGVNMNVANIACGAASSYPQPCGSASPPLTIATYGPFDTGIFGKVCARDQTSTTGIFAYAGQPGLVSGCVPPDADLPVFDKADFVSKMSNGSAAASSISCPFLGPAIATAANRTYTGNVTTGGCDVTINGSMYITGSLSAVISTWRVAESVGPTRPVIVVNGKISGISWVIRPNSYGTTPYIVSFDSADAACSTSDNCASITAAKLKETIDRSDNDAAIKLLAVTMNGTSVYAYFGHVYAQNGTIGAVAGQKVSGTFISITMNGKF